MAARHWFSPATLDEATALLGEHGHGLRVLAGGTDVMVERRLQGERAGPMHGWLDISRIDSLRTITITCADCAAVEDDDKAENIAGDGMGDATGAQNAAGSNAGTEAPIGAARIGAGVSLRDIARHPQLREHYPLLAASAAVTGALPIQNRATLGGNIANASPAADNPPVLLAYDAQLELSGPQGVRRIPYKEFHLGYRLTALREDELITAVLLPAPFTGARQYYRKVGTRQAQAIAKLSLAAVLHCDEQDRVLTARFGLASVAPTPIMLPALAQWLQGQTRSAISLAALRAQLAGELQPIDDIRSTAVYRREIAARLILEALHSPTALTTTAESAS